MKWYAATFFVIFLGSAAHICGAEGVQTHTSDIYGLRIHHNNETRICVLLERDRWARQIHDVAKRLRMTTSQRFFECFLANASAAVVMGAACHLLQGPLMRLKPWVRGAIGVLGYGAMAVSTYYAVSKYFQRKYCDWVRDRVVDIDESAVCCSPGQRMLSFGLKFPIAGTPACAKYKNDFATQRLHAALKHNFPLHNKLVIFPQSLQSIPADDIGTMSIDNMLSFEQCVEHELRAIEAWRNRELEHHGYDIVPYPRADELCERHTYGEILHREGWHYEELESLRQRFPGLATRLPLQKPTVLPRSSALCATIKSSATGHIERLLCVTPDVGLPDVIRRSPKVTLSLPGYLRWSDLAKHHELDLYAQCMSTRLNVGRCKHIYIYDIPQAQYDMVRSAFILKLLHRASHDHGMRINMAEFITDESISRAFSVYRLPDVTTYAGEQGKMCVGNVMMYRGGGLDWVELRRTFPTIHDALAYVHRLPQTIKIPVQLYQQNRYHAQWVESLSLEEPGIVGNMLTNSWRAKKLMALLQLNAPLSHCPVPLYYPDMVCIKVQHHDKQEFFIALISAINWLSSKPALLRGDYNTVDIHDGELDVSWATQNFLEQFSCESSLRFETFAGTMAWGGWKGSHESEKRLGQFVASLALVLSVHDYGLRQEEGNCRRDLIRVPHKVIEGNYTEREDKERGAYIQWGNMCCPYVKFDWARVQERYRTEEIALSAYQRLIDRRVLCKSLPAYYDSNMLEELMPGLHRLALQKSIVMKKPYAVCYSKRGTNTNLNPNHCPEVEFMCDVVGHEYDRNNVCTCLHCVSAAVERKRRMIERHVRSALVQAPSASRLHQYGAVAQCVMDYHEEPVIELAHDDGDLNADGSGSDSDDDF